MLNDEQVRDWDLYLKWVCCVLNSTKSRHTGFTANRLIFGRELNTPQSILLCDHSSTGPQTEEAPDSHAQKALALHWTIKSLIKRARQNGAADHLAADNWYNRNLHGPYFKEGEWCFVLRPCPSHKFAMRWCGPYRISKVLNDHLYYVELDDNVKLFNISKLKRYKKNMYSPAELDPSTPDFVPMTNKPVTSHSSDNHEETRPTVELEFLPSKDNAISGSESPHTSGTSQNENELTASPELNPEQPAIGYAMGHPDQLLTADVTHTEENTLNEPEEIDQQSSQRYPQQDRRPVIPFQAGN
jgi:hypothetical protein